MRFLGNTCKAIAGLGVMNVLLGGFPCRQVAAQKLTNDQVSAFARLALDGIDREYPKANIGWQRLPSRR